MSNRMSVLSRRLGRFAVCFSVITFAFFLFGLYANANNKSQEVLFLAVPASVCFFAAFFLWLAHGFAWAMIPEKPAVAMKSAETMASSESVIPVEVKTPTVAWRSQEVIKPVESIKPIEPTKPVEPKRPAEPLKPAEAIEPQEPIKPAEEKVIEPEDSPNAKYTITGRRIL